MNEIIYYSIINFLFLAFFNFANFFIFPKMLVIYLDLFQQRVEENN